MYVKMLVHNLLNSQSSVPKQEEYVVRFHPTSDSTTTTPVNTSTPTSASHPPQTLPATPTRWGGATSPSQQHGDPTVAGNGFSSGLSETSTGPASISSHSPLDPNLKCPHCGMQFREGEIQKYRQHTSKCAPATSPVNKPHSIEDYDYGDNVKTAEQPVDPNLTCLGCQQTFGSLQIQQFSKHCKSCDMFRQKKWKKSFSVKTKESSEEVEEEESCLSKSLPLPGSGFN